MSPVTPLRDLVAESEPDRPLTTVPDAPPPAATASPPERKRRASTYDVYEKRALFGEIGPADAEPDIVEAWVLIEAGVEATNDRTAIAKATAGFDDERRYGTFAAPLAGNFKPRTRTKTMQPVEAWS
jgi:hypothetical protein